MMVPSNEAREALELLQWPGVGPATVRRLLDGVPQGMSLLEFGSLSVNVASNVRIQAQEKAAEIVHRCEDHEIHIIGMKDPSFPPLLRRVSDCPPVIFARGSAKALTREGVAVVGTRKASAAGLEVAGQIAKTLTDHGMIVVSGLALGIDAAAHRGALENNGQTVAILAHGLHTIQPASNRSIGEEMICRGGALVSEHPPGVPARRTEFVRRNRLQSGMSVCSIVVESGIVGGAIHQANFTRKQGRPLFTVLSMTNDGLNEEGARYLMAEFGAVAIRTTGELLRALSHMRSTSEPPEQRSLW